MNHTSKILLDQARAYCVMANITGNNIYLVSARKSLLEYHKYNQDRTMILKVA